MAGRGRKKEASLLLAELSFDRLLSLQQAAAARSTPDRRRPRASKTGFAGALEALSTEDGCLAACLHNLSTFHLDLLQVRKLPHATTNNSCDVLTGAYLVLVILKLRILLVMLLWARGKARSGPGVIRG